MAQSNGRLLRYDAARRALAQCLKVDEVKVICDKADAMRVYAKRAKDRRMWMDAVEISARSKRRLGQLLIEAKERGEISEGNPAKINSRKKRELRTLSELGVDTHLSSEAQRLGAYSDDDFETVIARWREDARAGPRVTIDLLVYAAKVFGHDKEAADGCASRDPSDAVSKTLPTWFDLVRRGVPVSDLVQAELPREVGDEEQLLPALREYITNFLTLKIEQLAVTQEPERRAA